MVVIFISEKEFLIKYTEFYKDFLQGTAKSVNLIAQIQKDFKDDYEKIRDFSSNPNAIDGLLKKLTPEEQSILFKLLLRAGIIGRKMANIFELTYEEKVAFAKEINMFSKELENEIQNMMEKKGVDKNG